MADGIVGLQPDSTGKKVDTTEITVGTNLVERQRVHLAGTAAAALVEPINVAPAGTEYAVPTRNIPSGTQAVNIASGAIPSNVTVTGSLTASDAVVVAPTGDGALLSGASTAGSIVAIAVPSGFESWTLLIKNRVSGAIYTEASTNSTNGTDGDWTALKGATAYASGFSESIASTASRRRSRMRSS